MDIRQPLFIIGSPRSGTTLLRLMLTCHSDIIVPPESGFIVWLHKKYHAWSLSDIRNANARAQFLDDLFACKKFDTWELERAELDAFLVESEPADYGALCADIYMAYARKHSRAARIWGDKNNFHVNYLSVLHDIYPDARFLHIVRDGRDIACSYREVMESESSSPYSPRLNTDIDEISVEWATNVLKVNDYLCRLDVSKQKSIRYEDLVKDTRNCLADVCQWLGLSFEERMLDFHKVNRRMQLEPALTLDWKKRTLGPTSSDTVGRYRSLLPLVEQKRFSEVAGKALARFGYES